LSDEKEKKDFYIARDHSEYNLVILGGLWGTAMRRARHELFEIFKPMFIPSIARLYKDKGDQPFISRRPQGDCFLGCIRPSCSHEIKSGF
jgi:hypothetical protein